MELLNYINENMYLERYDMELFIYNKFAVVIKDKEEYIYVVNKLKEYIVNILGGTVNNLGLDYEVKLKEECPSGELCVIIKKPGTYEKALLSLHDYLILFSDKEFVIKERYKIIKFKQLILD